MEILCAKVVKLDAMIAIGKSQLQAWHVENALPVML
jgi:hypothetical protein